MTLPGTGVRRTEEAQLFAAAEAWPHDQGPFSTLTAGRLAEIAREQGIEFATALFHHRARRAPATAEFFAAMEREELSSLEKPDLVAVVPGAFYREHRDTGADGARVIAIAREIGCRAEVIPVAGFGRIEDNARIILDWLQARASQRIVLVSLSKGGADVKCALGMPEAGAAFANIATWIGFSGLVEGTPLIAWLRRRPLRWWGVRLLLWLRRHPGGALHDLRQGAGAPLARWAKLPEHLRIVHVCGVPLRTHLQHRWAPRAYDRLAPLGPNDGGAILLGDLTNVPGILCPVWGADHYLQPSWDTGALWRKIVVAALASPVRRHAR